jgi:quercetin dioxygenase-like cupin family protein
MTGLTTGRRLDSQGRPVEGTGFTYQAGDALDRLLQQRVSPLFSQPVLGEWIFALVLDSETGGEFVRGAGVFAPTNPGLTEHVHPVYDEYLEVVRGSFLYRVEGAARRLEAGDRIHVPRGVRHTFRCVGETYGVAIAETRPAARISAVIATLFGLAHEGKLTANGQPKFWQAMVIGADYADDTRFTSPPPAITGPMAKALAPLARRMGYRSTYPRYADPAFWSAHVEQPAAPVRPSSPDPTAP